MKTRYAVMSAWRDSLLDEGTTLIDALKYAHWLAGQTRMTTRVCLMTDDAHTDPDGLVGGKSVDVFAGDREFYGHVLRRLGAPALEAP